MRAMGKVKGARSMGKEYYEFDNETNEIKPLEKDRKKKKAKGIFDGVDKWKLAKQVIGTVASGCVSIMVSRYLKANMPETDSIVEKAVMGVGMYFFTGVAGSMAAKYAEDELESWRESITTGIETSDIRNGEED